MRQPLELPVFDTLVPRIQSFACEEQEKADDDDEDVYSVHVQSPPWATAALPQGWVAAVAVVCRGSSAGGGCAAFARSPRTYRGVVAHRQTCEVIDLDVKLVVLLQPQGVRQADGSERGHRTAPIATASASQKQMLQRSAAPTVTIAST